MIDFDELCEFEDECLQKMKCSKGYVVVRKGSVDHMHEIIFNCHRRIGVDSDLDAYAGDTFMRSNGV